MLFRVGPICAKSMDSDTALKLLASAAWTWSVAYRNAFHLMAHVGSRQQDIGWQGVESQNSTLGESRR
jgi:hypothetical protein